MTAPAPFKALLGARCVEDAERLRQYEIPERGAPGHASSVLLPESEDEVGTILRVAHEHGLKLVISAGRTGLVEAQRPEGEAVLSLEKLNRILELDVANRRVTAQTAVSIDALNEVLEPHGLVFPMEMGSSSAATVGACVANASAGANAVCYGTAAQMCAQAWGWWGDGRAAGPCAAPEWEIPPPAQLAISSARLHPDWGLIGAQGAAGVITRVQLRLHPRPRQREAVLLAVSNMAQAIQVLDAARAGFGSDVEEFEFMDRSAIQLVQKYRGAAFRSPFDRHDAPYYLLLQVKSEQAGDGLGEKLYALIAETLRLPDRDIGYAPLPVLKAIRHSITESSNARMRELGGGRLSYDTATPAAVFGDYLDRLRREITARYIGYQFIAFGHAGVGGAHLHVLGTQDKPVQAQAGAITKLIFDLTQELGGTFSAEHGVGSKWGAEFARRTPPEELARLLAYKREHDPRNVLNPRCCGFALRLSASFRRKPDSSSGRRLDPRFRGDASDVC